MAGGAPKGNSNAVMGKNGLRALEIALEDYSKDEPRKVIGVIDTLVKMWNPIIAKAMVEGDLMAMKEINDRLDGKATQALDITADITATDKTLTDEDIQTLARELSEDC